MLLLMMCSEFLIWVTSKIGEKYLTIIICDILIFVLIIPKVI